MNLAARLGQAAGPGEIIVTDTVRELVRTSEAPRMRPRDTLKLKGVADRPRTYLVDWSEG